MQFELKAKERSAKERSANPSGPIFPPRREQRKTVQSIQRKEKGQERHNQLLPLPQTKQLRVVPVNAHDPDARINLRFQYCIDGSKLECKATWSTPPNILLEDEAAMGNQNRVVSLFNVNHVFQVATTATAVAAAAES